MPWLSPSWSIRLSALLCVGAALLPAWSGKALAEKWEVEGDGILGEDGKRSRDVSGIACTTSTGLPRHCLVIDDNLQTGQFVTVKEGKLEPAKAVPLIDNFYDDKKLELDGEGVAFFGDSFYVMGSHGHPRHSGDGTPKSEDKIKAKIAAASQIVRVRLKESIGDKLSMKDVLEIRRTGKLREFIAADKTLSKYMDQPLERRADGTGNGVTIEGVAILNDRLYAGFRGPSIDGRGAPILSVPLRTLFGEGLDGAEVTVVKLDNVRGVRDLVAYGKGLLVLAGPTGDEAGQYDVHWWDGRSVDMQPLGDITDEAHAKKTSKPEGLLPLDESSRGLRLLILSDGNEAKDGEPRPVFVKIPKQD